MCGRLAQSTAIERTQALLDIVDQLEIDARYNVAPSQPLAVIRSGIDASLSWALPRWGLIPHWAKDIKIGYKMINAKAETIAEKPAFRGAFRYRRCIVPADGFYEWTSEGKRKQPFYIRHEDAEPMFLAGLWEHWENDNQHIESCAIITTAANNDIAPIHHRMPVILTTAQTQQWLDPLVQRACDLTPLLRPYTAGKLTAYKVDPRVNKPVNDDPYCIEPIDSTP